MNYNNLNAALSARRANYMYAIITKNGEKHRTVGNAVNYKGYLCEEKYVGVGKYHIEVWSNGIDDAGEDKVYEKYVPRYTCKFNSFLLEKDGISQDDLEEQFKDMFGGTTISKADIKDVIGTELEKYLVKVGENEGGLFVELKNPEQERSIESGEVCVDFVSDIFGFRCQTELPEHLWQLIEQYGTFHKGDDEDEEWAEEMGHPEYLRENLYGWFYNEKALETLKKKGLRVSYCGIEMKTASFSDVSRELEERRKKINRLKEFYQNTRKNMKYVPLEDIANTGLDKQHKKFFAIPEIGINGHNIYGSGTLLFADDSYLYVIDNNGMDGDEWSRNNLGTGGAGAIAYRTPLTKEVERWLHDCKTL